MATGTDRAVADLISWAADAAAASAMADDEMRVAVARALQAPDRLHLLHLVDDGTTPMAVASWVGR